MAGGRVSPAEIFNAEGSGSQPHLLYRTARFGIVPLCIARSRHTCSALASTWGRLSGLVAPFSLVGVWYLATRLVG